ncbi:MAG: hypothetical protein GJ676_17165 [Rhodobacteraceae bacterium]|nr:hypothetical protein [Paracoccaceae bacterium]
MPEPLSPLTNKTVAGHFGAGDAHGVTLGTRRVSSLWQIAGWGDFEAVAKPVLTSLGLSGLGCFRHAQQLGAVTVWRIAPDKILLEGVRDLAAAASEELMVLDLGHTRTAITVEGSASRDLLAQVIAIDTAPAAFGPGEFLQTGIHHVGVLIHCTGPDRFDILVPCTWAETIWEVLFDNALPHGLTIEEAA